MSEYRTVQVTPNRSEAFRTAYEIRKKGRMPRIQQRGDRYVVQVLVRDDMGTRQG